MNRKDLRLGLVIGMAVGLLVQPMLTTLSATLVSLGVPVNVLTRVLAFVFFSILAPLAIYIAYWVGKIVPVIYQFAKFAAVGTLNSFIDFGVVNLLIAVTGFAAGTYFVIFKTISFILSTTNSFIWNKLWTFDSKGGNTAGQAIRFYMIAGVGLLVNVGAASLVVAGKPAATSANLWANFAVLCGIFASFIWNFLGYKFVVFKKEMDPSVPAQAS